VLLCCAVTDSVKATTTRYAIQRPFILLIGSPLF
jgi:hypothetical protein